LIRRTTPVSASIDIYGYFLLLLGATPPGAWDPGLAAVLPPIEGLSALELPFTEEELRGALWSMRSDSRPGPDGFGPAFWTVVKRDMMAFLEEFHRGGAHLAAVNQAYITLLPKSDDVLTAGGFRPISLQNCAMKIITRILTSCLQPFIEQLVAFEQSGFIAGRCITDNFLYAAELVQCCRLRKTPPIALKLDFRKAFDSVSWSSLDAVLESRGFGVVFRAWVHDILRTGKAAVLVNGVPG
jgi:hypothetical protein